MTFSWTDPFTIADLLTDPNFVNNSPDQIYTESTIEEPYVSGPVGLQYLGYFRPAQTADYTFYITSDGESQVYLSPDDSPAHQSLICSQPGWSASRLWLHDQQGTTANNPAKVSAPIHLVAGSYFLQCLYKGPGNQNNNVSVTWSWTNALGQWQGVADYDTPQSTNLVPWSLSSGAVWVTPGATNLSAGGSFRLDGRFLAGAGGPITYQWYRGATPVGNGTLTYSAASATPGDAGLYTLVATVTPSTGPALNFTSAPVAVTVNLPRCTLTCANSAGTMLLSWGVTGVLEQSPSVDPALANWVPVPGAPADLAQFRSPGWRCSTG